MGAHTRADLQQMQSLPLEAKIMMTKRRIREWYEHWDGQVYVSFSGGKDSTVLKHIVDHTPGVYDVPSVFVNTGLEYPEIQQFVRAVKAGEYDCFNPDVEVLRPEMRFDEVIKEYGYPIASKAISRKVSDARKGLTHVMPYFDGTAIDGFGNVSKFNCPKWKFLISAPFSVSPTCCDVMKKKPFKLYENQSNRKSIIGTMAAESTLREKAWLKTGCNAFDSKKPKSQPLSFWTEQDILRYIKLHNVPYCSAYGDIVATDEDGNQYDVPADYLEIMADAIPNLQTTGCNRTGCMFCMFGCHLEKEPNRFQRLKETHPRQYEYCIGGGEYGPDGLWRPNSDGLGLGHVLDVIGVKY